MTDRKTVSTDPGAFAALRDQKRDGESWDDLYWRAAEALDGMESPGGAACDCVCNPDEVVTHSDLADFRAELARDLADEVENRLTRR